MIFSDRKQLLQSVKSPSVGSLVQFKRVHISFDQLDDYQSWVYLLLNQAHLRHFVSDEQFGNKTRLENAHVEFPLVRLKDG